MNDHIYKLIDLIGTSTTSVEDAVNQAIERASKTLKNLRWFEVAEVRGDIDQNKVKHWQVKLRVAFTLDERDESGSSKKK